MRVTLKPVLLSAAVLIVLLVAMTGSNKAAQGQEETPPQDEGRLLEELRDEGARVVRHPETEEVRFVGATKADPLARPDDVTAGAPAEEAAKAHLEEYGPLFGVEDQARELRVEEKDGDIGQGRAAVSLQQVHEGVPVVGGEINAEVDAQNNLLVATGETSPDLSVDTEPGISAVEAQNEAIGKIAKDRGFGADELGATEPDGLEATEPKLWIYDPALLGAPGPQVPSLVWRLEVGPGDGPGDFHELVLVDAESGAVLLNFDQVAHARNRETYTANNQDSMLYFGVGSDNVLVCDETDPSCSGGDADAKAAHRYAGDTYDFYMNNHGRDSIDGSGMAMESYVNHCEDTNEDGAVDCPYKGAFWHPGLERMTYGAGYAAADDVVGHELTHGVTQHESNLFYYYQSGAINESFSDVWGEFIDLTNGSGNDIAAVRWQIGEDLPTRGAIRDMKNPGTFNEPDRMRSPSYTADADEQDDGGVHTNSGVNNKAAYLMTDGATFNGKTVTGLGITKVAKIYYEVQTNLLTSGSDYHDLHSVLQQACANLTGTAGITATDCAEVKDAVDATEMHLQPTTAPAPEAPVCDVGQRPSSIFFDDLENIPAGRWSWTNHSGTDAWATPLQNVYAASGKSHFWGRDLRTGAGDSSLHKVTGVPLPPGKDAYLHFKHAYGFEDYTVDLDGRPTPAYVDGGIMEYSTDNGATWKDAGPLMTHNGYKGTLLNFDDNPLGGRQAFVGESNGYISTRVNLSSFAGQSVRFRFRIGTGNEGGDKGWFIDDIRLYNCDQVNDGFLDAWHLEGTSTTLSGRNVGTSKEAGEPNHAGNAGGRSVWYKWAAPSSGRAIIDTAGSGFDTLLGVYTGNAVSGLTHVASNDNYGGQRTSRATFTATAGTTYRIAVDGWNQNTSSGAATGQFELNLRAGEDAAPAVDLTAPANSSEVSGSVTMLADATNVDEVEFVANGTSLGADPSPPYDEPWDTGTIRDGRYTVSAWGNSSGYSPTPKDSHDVVVDNTSPETTIYKGPDDPTNDGSESIVYYAWENDAQFFCSLDGGAYSDCGSAKTAGTLAEVTYGNISEGSHTVRVYARGAGGADDDDPTPALWTFRVDRTPPGAPLISTPSNDALVSFLTLSGNAEADATVAIYDDGTQFGTTKADSSGSWRFTPNTQPTEGAHSFTAKATDGAGNVSPASAAKNVTIDRTPPGAVANLVAGPGDKRVDLSWTNPTNGDLAYVRVLRSETRSATTPEARCIDTGDLENPTECWSKIYEGTATSHGDVGTTRQPLVNGKTYYYTVYARDKTGNWSPSVSTSAAPAVPPPDTATPTVSLTSPQDGDTVSGASVKLSADATDNKGVTRVDFYVGPTKVGSDSTAGGTGGNEFSTTWDSTSVADGTRTITAHAYDAAGNEKVSAARTITVKNAPDTTKPTISLTSPASDATVSGTNVALKAEATDDTGVADVRFYVSKNGAWALVGTDTTAGGTSGKEYSFSWDSTSVPDGQNYFYADARDQASNGTYTEARTITVKNTVADTIAPTVSLTAPQDGDTLSGASVALSANASDDVGVSRVDFYVGTQKIGSDATAPYSLSWDSTTVADGTRTITARAYDAANNEKVSASRSVVVDNLWPNSTITGGPAEGSFKKSTSASFSFTSTDPDGSFECQLDSGPVESCTSGKSYSGLAQGGHTFSVWAIGSAGKAADTEQQPSTRTWTVDTVKPKGTVKINNGALTTRTLSVSLNLAATDPIPASGVSKMRFSHDGTTWTAWQTYAAKKAWTLKGSAGTKTVYAQFSDKAGNLSAAAKDTINYSP